MKHTNTAVSTITNLAYGLAGVALIQISDQMIITAVFLGVLMIGSAFHHWNLGALKIDITTSKAFDYIGMYGVAGSLIALGLGFTGLLAGISVGIGSLIITLLFGSSTVAVGILFAGAFAVMGIVSPLEPALEVAGWLSLAFGFNYLADTSHRSSHGLLHGVVWHIPSAVAAMKAAITIWKGIQ